MTKVRKISNGGTSSYEKEDGPQNWAGDVYRKVEIDRLKKTPKGKTMHLGRGVRTIKAKDLPEPSKRPSTEGMTRITGRGTGSRKSKNKGSPN